MGYPMLIPRHCDSLCMQYVHAGVVFVLVRQSMHTDLMQMSSSCFFTRFDVVWCDAFLNLRFSVVCDVHLFKMHSASAFGLAAAVFLVQHPADHSDVAWPIAANNSRFLFELSQNGYDTHRFTHTHTHTERERERERDACFALVTSRTHRNSHASTAASRTMACCLLDCHLYTVCSREEDQKHHHPKHQQNEMNSPIGQQRACGIKCDFHHIGNLPTQFGSPLQSNSQWRFLCWSICNCELPPVWQMHPERI